MYIRNPKMPSPYEPTASMFCKNNQYGFKINIMHPEIAPLLSEFKKQRKIPTCFPMDDKDRFEFEQYIFSLLNSEDETKEKST